jgi:hypothetical protein
MHSSVIGKIEKAHRYARERDRITVESLSVTFAGDNDAHRIRLDADGWLCNCHYFEGARTCAHIMALQEILGVMLPEAAQTSLFPGSPGTLGQATGA